MEFLPLNFWNLKGEELSIMSAEDEHYRGNTKECFSKFSDKYYLISLLEIPILGIQLNH